MNLPLTLAMLGGRAGPMLLMGVLLPSILILSPSLRRSGLLSVWCLAAVPSIFGLGMISSVTNVALAPPLFAIAALGAGFYVHRGRSVTGLALPLGTLAVGAALVAYFSSGHGGPEPMEHWYERYGLSKATADALTHIFRKTVHFTFYGTVGLSTVTAVRRAGASQGEALRAAFLVTLAVASCDELRQSGYANRSGSPWDVLLDLSGAVTFVGLSEWRRVKAR